MPDTLVLSEDEVLELVAFLVTAALLLPDEPEDYGPMRLVAAAQRLCTFAAPRSTEDTHAFLTWLANAATPEMRRRNSDPEAYRRFLDESSHAVVRLMARRAGRTLEA